MQIEVTEPADGIRAIRLDDGDKNVLTLEAVRALGAALEEAQSATSVNTVLLSGRDNALSVGLDTATVLQGDDAAQALMAGMGRILAMLYLGPLRSVVVTRGHATAAGAMLLLVADHRIGIAGNGKIGLSEVRVGLEVPPTTRQLVRDRINTRWQYAATALAQLFDCAGALDAGFLDRVVATREEAMAAALTEARRLHDFADGGYVGTKRGMRTGFARLVGESF